MAHEESFLARWSRLKRGRAPETAEASGPAAPAAAEACAVPAEAPAAPALPPVEELTPDSDFSAFMSPKVADALRRQALKKLFRHPEIDLPDPYEPFSGDWTGGEPIPDEMLKSLYQARDALLRESEAKPDEERADAPPPETREGERSEPDNREANRTDEPGRQDA